MVCGIAEGSQEARAVVYAFDVGGDYLRLIVLGEILQEVRLIEVQRVPVADGLAEAQSPLAAMRD
jgi:hypothetical protein